MHSSLSLSWVLILALFVVHQEGHKIAIRDTLMSTKDVERFLSSWKQNNDANMAAVTADIQMLKQNANEIAGLRAEIQKLKLAEAQVTQKLESSKMPPVGFIYVQYGGQYSPSVLWPGASWTDVSSQYAGAFFRAVGGHSESFGQNQRESMRTLNFEFLDDSSDRDLRSTDNLPYDSWVKVTSGGRGGSWNRLHVYYHQKGTAYASRDKDNEVRPFNQAVLIWRRTA